MDAPSAPAHFAREAAAMLRDGRKEAALELSADGVRTFPTYIGGYILLADAYAALGALDDAQVILNEARRRFPSRKVVAVHEAELAEIRTMAQALEAIQTPAPQEAIQTPAPQEVRQSLIARRRPHRERTEPTSSEHRRDSPLRVIELGPPTTDDRVIRSSAVRLVPGLEYTSLRFEGSKVRGDRSINVLPDAPPFRSFHSGYGRLPAAQGQVSKGARSADHGTVTLEQLADRIGRVRMTSEALEAKPPAPDPLQDTPKQGLVTETLARIYMQQRSFDRAIESFTVLMSKQPDRADEFQKLIDECARERDAN